MAYTPKQKRRAKHIYGVGRRRGESNKEILAALETALVEANLGNPTEAESDQDSAGWRQERSHYGSQAKRRNVRGAARRFFNETSALGDGKGMSAAELAQAVQRSAYPGRYGEREGQARDLLAWLDKDHGKGGGGRKRGGLALKSNTIPGVDNSPLRDQLKFDYLSNRDRPDALLSLAQGLSEAKDIAPTTDTRLVRKKGSGGRERALGGTSIQKDGWKGARSAGAPLARIGLNQGLKAVSEKRDTVSTASGGVSDHYSGNKEAYAWDLSNGSQPTPEMDRAARKIARQLGVKNWKGGVLNVNKKVGGRTFRYQLLYRTNVGGNHYDHVHLGVRRLS